MTLVAPIALSPTAHGSRRGSHRAETRSPLLTAMAISAAATTAVAPQHGSTAAPRALPALHTPAIRLAALIDPADITALVTTSTRRSLPHQAPSPHSLAHPDRRCQVLWIPLRQ
jgi:hypothetical protein